MIDITARGLASKNASSLAAKATDYVLVSNYASFQAAINDAQTKVKNVNLNNQTVNINGNITIPSNIKVYNGTINFTALASVQLSGTNPSLENITIQANSYSQWDTGVISLIATTGASIKNVTINGNLPGIGVYCKTQASNTIINGLTITGSLSYGILFNDAQSQQPAGYRTVNGVDYSSLSIGSGLVIKDYTYNNTSTDNTTYFGDGVELNCPDHGFSNVTIINANITNPSHKNVSGSASGMGIGMANCSSIIVNTVTIKGSQFDGLHFEDFSTNILVTNFLVDSSYTGIKLASSTSNVIFKTGIVTNCTQWLIQTDSSGTSPIKNVDVEDVIFDTNVTNTSFPDQVIKGIHLSGANNLHFKNIRCQNFSLNDTIMRLGLSEFNSALNDIYDSVFENIFFIKGSTDITTQLLKLGSKSTGCNIQNMKKIGYTNDLGFVAGNGNKLQPFSNTQLTGLATFSGNGSTNFFTIPHNLGTQPSYMNVTPYNSATGTAGIDHISVDTTNMTVFTKTAPVTGTNNVSFYWMVSRY